MASSNEWTEWHLTPRGWERGTEKIDFGDTEVVIPPEDRVLTCVYRQYMGWGVKASSASPVEEEWRSDDEDMVYLLLEEHGECPMSL